MEPHFWQKCTRTFIIRYVILHVCAFALILSHSTEIYVCDACALCLCIRAYNYQLNRILCFWCLCIRAYPLYRMLCLWCLCIGAYRLHNKAMVISICLIVMRQHIGNFKSLRQITPNQNKSSQIYKSLSFIYQVFWIVG